MLFCLWFLENIEYPGHFAGWVWADTICIGGMDQIQIYGFMDVNFDLDSDLIKCNQTKTKAILQTVKNKSGACNDQGVLFPTLEQTRGCSSLNNHQG